MLGLGEGPWSERKRVLRDHKNDPRQLTFADWWRVGAVLSVVNLAIWLTVGFAWWKWLGFW